MQKYKYYLPSYEECRAICDKYDNFQFYEGITYVDGYKISFFNYRLIGYNDFIHPLGPDSEVKSTELRGISYVFNTDGTLFKRFLLLNKFFNLNQVEETQLSLIKDIKIKEVYDKVDGSLINFIQLPNGRIMAKTKMKLDNDQALWAQDIYENSNYIKEMVQWALDCDIMPIMEFVSPKNRVVLKYYTSELILLKFRDLNTGEYLNLDIYPDIDKIKCCQKETYTTWEELEELSKTEKNKEGFVAILENGMMVKKKTVWYNELHHTLTESIHREDFLISKVIDEEIDDVIALVDPDDKEILDVIDNVIVVVCDYLKQATIRVEQGVEKLKTEYNGSKKDFIASYGKRDKYLGYILSVYDGKEIALSIVSKDLKKRCYRLEEARSFIENKEF